MDLIGFLGYPGCGKGTQAKLVCDKMGYTHISTGDDLRNALPGSALYRTYKDSNVGEANFAPDADMFRHVTGKIINHRFDSGIILDGYPRNVNQAYLFDSFLELLAPSSFQLVYFDLDRTQAFRRLQIRAQTESREDDSNSDKINRRLDIYEHESAKLLEYYSSRNMPIFTVDASLSVQEVSKQMEFVLSVKK